MRALGTSPLDDDIVDRIMTFCPTLATLRSMILVSKDFHRIFQTHPKSITREVAYNIVGPALPQALRVLRYPYPAADEEDEDEEVEIPVVLATACPEEHEVDSITADEAHKLEELATSLRRLEDVYSLTNKDRTSMTSVLIATESLRFHRAAYRITLYCRLFPGDRYDYDAIDELGDAGIETITAQRAAVLDAYPTDQLRELAAAVAFLRGVFEEVADDQANVPEILLSTGPVGALTAWETRSCDELEGEVGYGLFSASDEIPLFDGYFSRALERVWAKRGIAPPSDDEPLSKYILDSVNGENDTCSQCSAPGGVKLLNEANWSRLTLSPNLLMKSKLKLNPAVFPAFNAWCNAQDFEVGDALGVWIASVFAMHRAIDDDLNVQYDTTKSALKAQYTSNSSIHPRTAAALASPTLAPFASWNGGQSYCEPCLRRFLLEHVWVWWFEERVRAGWNPPEDCRNGYDCVRAAHKQHAEEMNHLCAPVQEAS
ncbi:hypothetical protein C8R43DRAFT_607943 [Mycena crocata]|nr:hypothetical protein C8R43DRAFT_607943 [Mycena crocata]